MLHSEAVSRLSKSLNALVNGQMKEATESCAVWEDIDADTFVRFSKFAYTGDYDAAEPRLVVSSSDEGDEVDGEGKAELPFANASISSVSPKEPVHTGWGARTLSYVESEAGGCNAPAPSPSPARRTPRTQALWEDFVFRYCENGWGDIWGRRVTNLEDEDYTEVFLSHARMAVFADYHGVSALERLALQKLTLVLSSFHMWDAYRIEDITRLISYVYEHTVQLPSSPCPLRELVCQYSACKMEVLWKSVGFKQVFETYTDFAKDLTDQLLKRL
jgi:hypothetical protein